MPMGLVNIFCVSCLSIFMVKQEEHFRNRNFSRVNTGIIYLL